MSRDAVKGLEFVISRRRARGLALVTTLALVVLATVAILAFFSFATANRRIEASRANRVKAEVQADSGMAYVISWLLAEIAESDKSSVSDINGVRIYTPTAPRYAVPQRQLAASIAANDEYFYNLLRQSVTNADDLASAHSTAQAARNGRKLDAARWNTPVLLGDTGFTQDDQLPHWIYIDRYDGLTATPSANVIGRFAYNMYDIGGLLNANVTGYPDSLDAGQLTRLKTGQMGADLTRLSATGTAGVGMALFRYPDLPHPQNPESFINRMLGAGLNGFLSAYNLDWQLGTGFRQNLFVGRQDLIRYVHAKNPGLQTALPWFTHFSRAVNAPAPLNLTPSNYSYNEPEIKDTNQFNVRFAAAGTVAHYDDRGTAGAWLAMAGEPLVQRRFSLAKLAWLTPSGPANGISAAAVKSCFGLEWNSGEERWDYVGSTDSGGAKPAFILTLAEITAEAALREPNFFELLKAGILDSTLGASALGKTSETNKAMCLLSDGDDDGTGGGIALDRNRDLHVLKIGANIIDQADADNYPTIIAMTYGSFSVEQAGVEDLPYLYAMNTGVVVDFRPLTAAEIPDAQKVKPDAYYILSACDFVWIPELLNPHRPSVTVSGPDSVSVEIGSAMLQQVGNGVNSSMYPQTCSDAGMNLDLAAAQPTLTVERDEFEQFRAGPLPLKKDGAANSLGKLLSNADPILSEVLGWHIFSYTQTGKGREHMPYPLPYYYSSAGDHVFIAEADSIIIRLRYRAPGGKLKTYATLGGNEALPQSTGVDGMYRDDFLFHGLKHSEQMRNLSDDSTAAIGRTMKSPSLVAYDPRGSRFGPCVQRYRRPVGDKPRFNIDYHNSVTGPYLFFPNVVFHDQPTLGTPNGWTGNLPQAPLFIDPDGKKRTPDAGIGFAAPGSASTATNPYASANLVSANAASRPVILQRPFRSVAELGYVYRDVPWQTLNFFNADSGDTMLLDLFSVTDEAPLTAGRVSLFSRHHAVHAALLSGAAQLPDGTLTLTDAQAVAISGAWREFLYDREGKLSEHLPLTAGGLAVFMSDNNYATLNTTVSSDDWKIKWRREAVARALGGGQTRTWNVLVDVVAQAGRFSGGSEANNFIVEGESRMWTAAAIDRYTGRVLEQQREKVNE
jgi:Tfp pilus assembly protein PilX